MPCLFVVRHILLVGVALQRTSLGARESFEEKEVEPSRTICCCRGPLELQCRRLAGSQLENGTCPEHIGYKSYEYYFPRREPDYAPHGEPCSATEPTSTRNVIVNAYWIRHGWSCANALKSQIGGLRELRKHMGAWGVVQAATNPRRFINDQALYTHYPDPPLTDVAKERGLMLGNLIRKKIAKEIRLVFSSVMERAMETALVNFPGSDVYPIPYIAEVGNTADNIPSPAEANASTAEASASKLRLSFDAEVNPANHPDRGDLKVKSDYLKFKRYFPMALHKLLGGNADDEINVVIVGHSKYMKKKLAACGGHHKPENNEVWLQKYQVTLGAYDAELKDGECKPLFPFVNGTNIFPSPPDVLCKDDVSSCTRMKPDIWLKKYENDAECGKDIDMLTRDTSRGELYTTFLSCL